MDIIYHILEQREEWVEKRTRELEEASRNKSYIQVEFFTSRPYFPCLKTCGSWSESVGWKNPRWSALTEEWRASWTNQIHPFWSRFYEGSKAGAEVAVAIDGVTVGRQIEEEDMLLVDIPESHARS